MTEAWERAYPDGRNQRIKELEAALLESNDAAARLTPAFELLKTTAELYDAWNRRQKEPTGENFRLYDEANNRHSNAEGAWLDAGRPGLPL